MQPLLTKSEENARNYQSIPKKVQKKPLRKKSYFQQFINMIMGNNGDDDEINIDDTIPDMDTKMDVDDYMTNSRPILRHSTICRVENDFIC